MGSIGKQSKGEILPDHPIRSAPAGNREAILANHRDGDRTGSGDLKSMSALLRLMRILRGFFRRRQLDRQIEEEVQSYASMMADNLVSRGMNPHEARRHVRLHNGGFLAIRESIRDARSEYRFDADFQDIRYAGRVLRKNPNYTLAAIFALTLGIGATTSVFSVADAILLRPLPFRDPDGLYAITVSPPGPRVGVSVQEYEAWTRESTGFESIVASVPTRGQVTGMGAPEFLAGNAVPAELFQMLGVEPVIGRTFTPQEDRPGAEPVLLLDYAVWQEKFGGDASVLGRTIVLANETHTIVGV